MILGRPQVTPQLAIIILTIAVLLFVFVPSLGKLQPPGLMGAAFRPNDCCMRSSLTPNLARVFLTRVLNASLSDRELIQSSLFGSCFFHALWEACFLLLSPCDATCPDWGTEQRLSSNVIVVACARNDPCTKRRAV